MTILLDNITFGYQFPILKNFSLTLPDEGIFCFCGPSGCGKTTLFYLLAGLRKPQSGTITGLGHRKIAMTFQENRLFPWFSAWGNIAVVSNDATAQKYLQEVGLTETAKQYPSQLSGGMQRRIAIARALAYGGDVLLLDEPFQGLDTANKLRLIPLIKAAASLVLVITHDREDLALFTTAECVYHLSGPPLRDSISADSQPDKEL